MTYSNRKYEGFIKKNNGKNVITIFTPTYNRDCLLYRVYECLQKQTSKDFIWIIINDGSKDDTDNVAKNIADRDDLPILYISKPNGGKHSAFERAFNETHTEYFMCMDDDDIYAPDAIKTYLKEWNRIKEEGKYSTIGAIRTITQEEDGAIVSRKKFDKALLGTCLDQTTLVSNYLNHEGYENWTCYRTDALREIDLFPKSYWMHEQHKFFSESIWQGRFARKFQCRYLFVVLREYRHDTKTSIIRSNKSRQHYMDMFINTKMILDEQLDFLKKSPIDLMKNVAIVCILRNKLHIPVSDLLRNTDSMLLKTMYSLVIPFACLSKKPVIKE